MVIQDLEEKVKQASTDASDEFMYQDKSESQRELEVARKILEDIPRGNSAEEFDTALGIIYHMAAIGAMMRPVDKIVSVLGTDAIF